MTMTIMPQGRQRYYDNDGNLAAGCLLYAFAAGTSTPKATYQDSAGSVPHAHPIELDAKGEAVIFWSGAYKVDLKTAAGAQITGWPVDNITTAFTPADLSGAAGSGLIGFTYATAYSVGTIGRWLKDLATSVGSTFIGFLQAGAGAVLRTMQDKSREWKTPEDFGAEGDNPAHDDTAAFTALFASAAANGHSVMLPRKTYYITSLTVLGCNETVVVSQGAKLRGAYTGSYSHLLRIDQTSITMNVTGTIFLDGVCNTGYSCTLFIGSGYNDISCFTFLRCALCMRIDRDFQISGERGVSEIKVIGGYSYACLRIVEALGYNTIVNFIGFVTSSGLLADANTADLPGGVRPAAWDAADSTTIRAIGSTLFFSGAHLTNVRGTALIDVQPIITAATPLVPISYGSVFITNCNVEANVLGGATNPNAYVTPDDPKINISITGSQGFIGGNSVWISLDSTFKGKVRIKDNSFYSNAARSAYIGVSASAAARWDVDIGSFGLNIAGTGHGAGLNALSGGIAHFPSKQVLHVDTSATSTASNGSVIPACSNSVDVGNSARFIAAYAGGIFTVPAGGLSDVVFDMQFALAAASATADVGVKLNGTLYAFGPYTASTVKAATAYFPLLAAGDTLQPFIANNTGGAVACDGSTLNRIIITASNP